MYIYVPYFWVYSTWCVERHRKAVKGFLVRYECVCVKCVNRLTAFSGKDDFDPTLVNSEEIWEKRCLKRRGTNKQLLKTSSRQLCSARRSSWRLILLGPCSLQTPCVPPRSKNIWWIQKEITLKKQNVFAVAATHFFLYVKTVAQPFYSTSLLFALYGLIFEKFIEKSAVLPRFWSFLVHVNFLQFTPRGVFKYALNFVVSRVCVHAICCGCDTPPKSYLCQCSAKC